MILLVFFIKTDTAEKPEHEYLIYGVHICRFGGIYSSISRYAAFLLIGHDDYFLVF